MSAFGGLIFTNKGRNLQAKAQAGAQLNFTRIAIGDGDLGGSSIADLNSLIHQVKTIDITKLITLPGGKAVVGGSFSNQDIIAGFYWKELGVFAQDPDLGEILYCYGNSGANAEYIPAGGGPDVVEKNIAAVTIVGNAADVTATIEQSLIFVTQQEFDDLAGVGRTNETVKGNADALALHASDDTVHVSKVVLTPTASLTLGLTDSNKLLRCYHDAVAIVITIPADASVNFPIGTEIALVQWGLAEVSIAAEVGVTIRSKDNKLKINGQFTSCALKKTAANNWLLVGALKA